MPETNYLDEIEREDGQILTVRDKEARAAIDGMNPTLQQILQGVNDIKNGIGDTKTIIDAILSGEAPIPQVRFLDYDGTVVETYTAKEFATLTELPANPTHEGLTSQGWNWSLADAKTYVADNGVLDIGQMYVTSDGKTRLYISLPEGRTSPILQLYLNANSELDIDWGDSSTHSTFTSTTANYKSERHEYSSSGDYVIAITVVSGGFVLQSSSVSNVSLILSNGNDSSSSPDLAYNNAIKKIEIGNGVTSIGDKAFQRCYSLSSITIPDSVTSIGNNAFQICYALSSVIIPDSVTSIGNNAFQICYALSSVIIPDSVTSIGNDAFNGCYSLSSVIIPNSVTSIKGGAFSGCYSLSSITIPDSVTSIADYTFNGCYSLSSVIIPNSVTSIKGGAFSGCYSLSSITIPDSVTSIGNNAFNSCYSLSSITIPDSVTSIGDKAFNGCYSLSSITIPNSVTSIKGGAFSGCASLSSITIPDSVTSIGNNAFNSCASLSSITIPDSVTSIGNNAFNGCYSLSSITIPDSVTSIGNNAFNSCYSLSSITIPDSVTSIADYTFNGCYSLSSITIPNSVTSIKGGAFSGCAYMSFIKFESGTPPTVPYSNAWSDVSTSTVIYVPALVSNWYMDSTNYPAKASYKYLGYATYKSGTALPTTTRDERYTLTWYATSADAIAQTNPITQGTGDEVYSRATPVV